MSLLTFLNEMTFFCQFFWFEGLHVKTIVYFCTFIVLTKCTISRNLKVSTMSKKKKSKAQADAAEVEPLFSKEIISSIVNSSDPKGDLRKLVPLSCSENEITNHIGQYLKAHYLVNKDFELSLRRYYFKNYVDALKETLAFVNEERFDFLAEIMEFKIPEFIGAYFLKCDREPNIEFEKNVAAKFPEVFVEKIRSCKAFLQPNRFDFYSKDESLNIPIEHLETWKYLKDIENALWSKVEESFKMFTVENQKLPTEAERFCSAMVEIIVWMEEKRWSVESRSSIEFRTSNSYRSSSRSKLSQNSSSNDDCSVLQRPMFFTSEFESTEIINELLGCYSLFVDKYVRDNGISVFALNELETNDLFNGQLLSTMENGISLVSQELFETIFSWISFYNGILSTYCYNMNVKPILRTNGDLYLTESAKDYYRWKLDGCRYDINRKACFELGKERKENAMVLLLNDLCLDKIIRNGEEIDTTKAFQPMAELSIQKHDAYEKRLGLIKFMIETLGITKTWKEYYKESQNAKKDEEFRPFVVITKNSLFQLAKENDIQGDKLEHYEKLFDGCFCFRFDDNEFNRYKSRSYNAMSKPFLEVCPNTYFCPTLFFANNDWFYVSADKIIEMFDNVEKEYRKRSTDRMEELLANLFKKYGFITVCNHDGNKKRKGDVDIVVEGKDTALLIQLKRTKFRPNLSEQYLEPENTDNKAARQLNNYEYKGDKKKVVRWYVTNLYENCLKEYDDPKHQTSCIKVNYFDLVFVLGLPGMIQQLLDNPSRIYPPLGKEALDEMRQLKKELVSLDGIIKYITEDRMIKGHSNWKDAFLSRATGFSINGTLFPTITEPCKAYEILLKTENTDAYERLNSIVGNTKLDIDERLIIAEELSNTIPDDYRVWDVLADLYTDKEEFDKAIECCKKALTLLPNDPYLLRNYIVTLYKEKKTHNLSVLNLSEEETKVVKILLDEYWFLDNEIPSEYLFLLKNKLP